MGTDDDIFVPITAASYDATSETVTLTPSIGCPTTRSARLEITSGGSPGLTGSDGQAIDGDGDGTAGGDFIARFGRGVYLNRAEVLPGHRHLAPPCTWSSAPAARTYQPGQIAPLFAHDAALTRYQVAQAGPTGTTTSGSTTGKTTGTTTGSTASAAQTAASQLAAALAGVPTGPTVPQGPLSLTSKASKTS